MKQISGKMMFLQEQNENGKSVLKKPFFFFYKMNEGGHFFFLESYATKHQAKKKKAF